MKIISKRLILSLIFFLISNVVSAQCNEFLTSYLKLDKEPLKKNTHAYNPGVFSKGTPNYISEINGKKVFLLHKKIIMNQETKLKKTINWMKRLSDLNVSPLFRGLALVNDTKHLVSDFIYPSVLFKPLNNHSMSVVEKKLEKLDLPKRVLLLTKWSSRLREIQETLMKENIMTIDLQFLATMKGEIYIIDPDLYQEAGKLSDFDIQNKEFEFLYQYFADKKK